MSKSPVTCHVLDSTLGKPAANVRVQLEALSPSNAQFHTLATGATNSDGRCPDLLAGKPPKDVLVPKGVYKMTFFTGEYFAQANRPTFYPQVEVSFLYPCCSCPSRMIAQRSGSYIAAKRIMLIPNFSLYAITAIQILFQLAETPDAHYHIPLLLSPFSYTTYRGS